MNPSELPDLLVRSAWITARVAAFVSVLIFVAASRITRLRASRMDRGPVREHDSGAAWSFAAMVGVLAMGAALAWATRDQASRWLPLPAQAAIAAVAAVSALAAGAFGAWAWVSLGANISILPTVRERGFLVTTGPYAIVRHPVYLAWGILVVGIGLALGSLSGTAAWMALYIPTALWRATAEDRLLARAYPTDFPEYAKSVPALLPWSSRSTTTHRSQSGRR